MEPPSTSSIAQRVVIALMRETAIPPSVYTDVRTLVAAAAPHGWDPEMYAKIVIARAEALLDRSEKDSAS